MVKLFGENYTSRQCYVAHEIEKDAHPLVQEYAENATTYG